MGSPRYPYAVLETALAIRHRLEDEDLESVRTRIRHLRNAGFPEAGQGSGRALDYDGDGILQLVLAHDLIGYGAAPTWAARVVLTDWADTRAAFVRASRGEQLHLVLHPAAVNDTLGRSKDVHSPVSSGFTTADPARVADLLGGDHRHHRIMFIECGQMLEHVHDALGSHGFDPTGLFGSPSSPASGEGFLDRAWEALLAGDARLAAQEMQYSQRADLRRLQALVHSLSAQDPEWVCAWLDAPNARIDHLSPRTILAERNAVARGTEIGALGRQFGVPVEVPAYGVVTIDELLRRIARSTKEIELGVTRLDEWIGYRRRSVELLASMVDDPAGHSNA